MLKPIKIGLALLLILIGMSLASCANLPAPPVVTTYILYVGTDLASSHGVGVPSQSSLARGTVSVLDATVITPLSQMNNFVAFSPADWGKIEAYLLKLKNQAQCKAP